MTFQADFDNESPSSLPISCLIYGLKDVEKTDIPMAIYDCEKVYEIINSKFKVHMLIDVSNNIIFNLGDAQNESDPLSKKSISKISYMFLFGEVSKNRFTSNGQFLILIL